MEHNLFSFDLSKKKVLIKNLHKKKDINLENEEEKISSQKLSQVNIYNINEKGNNQNSANNEDNTINIKDIAGKKKKRRNSKKLSSTIEKNIEEKEKIENKEVTYLNKNKKRFSKISEQNNATALSNNKILSEDVNKKTISGENEARNIKKNVYINCFFVIFAFCCIRKRKNDNCYVLEEGLDIIKERLDVLNIFKRLYFDEKIQDMYTNKSNEIEMSDKCKQKLQ